MADAQSAVPQMQVGEHAKARETVRMAWRYLAGGTMEFWIHVLR